MAHAAVITSSPYKTSILGEVKSKLQTSQRKSVDVQSTDVQPESDPVDVPSAKLNTRKRKKQSAADESSALTAETVFEIIKCISHVDMPACGRMGSKSEIFRFFNSGYAHDRNILIFRRRASTVTGNTLIKPNYARVRQSSGSKYVLNEYLRSAVCMYLVELD